MNKVILFLGVAMTASHAQTLTPVVAFDGSNGAGPAGGLIQATDGNYYGVTGGGGLSGDGTIYRLTPAGVLTTIYTFARSDGAYPGGGLIQGTDGNFYGVTSGGGSTGYGTVFKVTPGGVLTTLHSFTMAEGYSPNAPLIQGTDGNFYGTTPEGGSGSLGSIFKITSAGAMTVLYSFYFTGESGRDPFGGLVQGSDGNFYGVTQVGGPAGFGTIFEITPSGTLTNLYTFSGPDGSQPAAGLTLASDGNFYGTTYYGGSSGNGTVFRFTPADVLTTLHNFSSAEGYGARGGLLQAGDGNFYGAMQYGGGKTFGSLFTMTPGGALTTLYTFSGNAIDIGNGIQPNGYLIQGSNGNIYGTAAQGGSYSDGIIFALAVGGLVQLPAVVTGTASSVSNGSAILSSSISANGGDTQAWFQYSVNGSMAGSVSTTPQDIGAGLVAVSFSTPVSGLPANTTYYFQAFASNSAGTSSGSIASFTTAGAAVYNISGTVLLSGAGLSGVGIVLSGNQGMTVPTDNSGNYVFSVASGGTYNVTPAANGYTFAPPSITFTGLNVDQIANFTAVAAPVASLTTLASFDGTNGDGATPRAALIQAGDGNFYGTTASGGANNLGTIFKITPSGTPTILHSFDGNDGSSPQGALLQVKSGSLYGTARSGGTGSGTVFQVTSAGAFTSLQSFGQSNGAYPEGALIQATTDGNLYGTTEGSGAFEPGTVFRITPAGALTALDSLASTQGNGPESGLLQGSDGNFYGTIYGGPGAVFKMTPSGSLTVLYTFCALTDCADGGSPNAALIQAADGNFYGTAAAGGVTAGGVVFKITPTGTLTVLHSFSGPDGSSPNGLLLGIDGSFYGTTSLGGANAFGTLFQMTPAGGVTTLHSFNGTDGADPVGPLIQASDGNFYGVTQGGGISGLGTVFRLDLPNSGPIVYPSSGVVNAASYQSGISANSWISILGANLSSTTDTWANAISNGVLPQSLDGVSVSVGGQPAYVAYVSPGQINALAPNTTPGNVSVTVRNGLGASTPVTALAQILQPAFFQWGSYAVATRTDYSLAVKNGTFPGVTTIPAKSGDTIVLWGTGFGPTTPIAPAGMVVPSETPYNTANPVMVSVGGVGATVLGAALTAGDAGLYQIAVQIPAGLPNGDYPVLATVSGVESPSNVLITIQN
jgi:uncharacterized protein (TIGR03437 family)